MDETKPAPDSVMARLVKIDGQLPRLWKTTLLAIALLFAMYFMAPALMGVIQHKVTLQVIAVVIGYAADRAIFSYARPHVFLDSYDAVIKKYYVYGTPLPEQAGLAKMYLYSFGIASLRRAIIVAAAIIGIALGA